MAAPYFLEGLYNGMTQPLTNDAFLKSKITNFVDFLTACLFKRLDNARFSEFKNKIEELRACDTGLFIVHVTESMVPFRTNVPAYVEKMLAENNAKASELTEEEHGKLCRYITMFIDVASQ